MGITTTLISWNSIKDKKIRITSCSMDFISDIDKIQPLSRLRRMIKRRTGLYPIDIEKVDGNFQSRRYVLDWNEFFIRFEGGKENG